MSVSLYRMAEKNVKKRNWAFVLYPESAPKDWREQLQKTGLQCVISPLHDKDLNPTGEPKKPHYHVILCYSGPTAYNVVKRLTNGQLGQTIPQPLEQVRGYYRYLTHEDNPEKAQYSKTEIQTINGFDIREFVEISKSETIKIKREIQEFIRDNGMTEYAVLMDALLDAGEAMADHYEVASNNTLFFKSYLTSRWRMQGHELSE
ncbi:replication protein [Flintibacter porci]|uniref:replication protein n=1 Tax=Flintibacter porci TaxID=3342383 RepID=UPI003F8986C5